MSRLSLPLGIGLSLALLAILVAVGLRSEPAPDADLRNGQSFIQDNLWSTPTTQYAVWVAPDGTPMAGERRDGGAWRTVDLGRLPGNPFAAPTVDDTHNVYAIGVDAAGGVHVAGNMKASALRYARARPGLRRWSTRPAPAAGASATYPGFTALLDGTLLFWHQEGNVVEPGTTVLHSLAQHTRRWRRLGAILDGRPSGEIPYLHHVAVDPRTGAVHIMFEWRGDENVETTNDVGYATSADGGRTWRAGDGTPLSLPITHSAVTTVIDTPDSNSGLINGGGMTLDAEGRPHGVVTFVSPNGGERFEHLWLDDGTWHREDLGELDVDGRPQLAGTPDGRVWLLGADAGEVNAIDITPGEDSAGTKAIARVPPRWEVNYDSQALARDGVVEMLIPEGSEPHVVEAPLTGD